MGRDIGLPLGGNDAIQRCVVTALNSDAIEGTVEFTQIHNGRIRFEALDRPNTPLRMRIPGRA
jgi:hypothetical protein